MIDYIKKILGSGDNINNRDEWLKTTLSKIPQGKRILDAGAGELKNKPLCDHLEYVSQDFCEYTGGGDGAGLQMGEWDTHLIDIVSDISEIPEPDNSFDVILCSEVFEHVPDPLIVIREFNRLLRREGLLIITAPFASLVHFAPYYYCSGFSKYWYEYHLERHGFVIKELEPNGDWFTLLNQEIRRLPSMAKQYNAILWPVSYLVVFANLLFLFLRGKTSDSSDVACFGWHCIAEKK